MKIFMRRGVGYFSTFPKDKLIFVSDTSMGIKKGQTQWWKLPHKYGNNTSKLEGTR